DSARGPGPGPRPRLPWPDQPVDGEGNWPPDWIRGRALFLPVVPQKGRRHARPLALPESTGAARLAALNSGHEGNQNSRRERNKSDAVLWQLLTPAAVAKARSAR